ncbi:MAG: calcium/sodium antiporter [Chthoniobacterales bacterium]
MVLDGIFVLAGLLMLYFGAEWLVRGSASLALRFGLSPLVVGLTVVAFGTSAPELLVSIKAALDQQAGMAVGNVIGSNIFNIAVVLGVAALIKPMSIQFQLIRFDVPIMVGACVLAAVFLRDGEISRFNGSVFVGLLVAYAAASVVVARKHGNAAVEAEFENAVGTTGKSAWLDGAILTGGLIVLVLGAQLLVEGASGLARGWGISEAVIGLTIVAAGTSTPELAATIVASLRGEADIAVGNVVGSTIYNVLCILGIASLIHPLDAQGVTSVDVGVMIGVCLLLVPFIRTGFTLRRWEGGILLGIYAAYLGWLVSQVT